MRQEDVQLAIRPRTILECLDLAFLFCGRNFLGLLLVSAVGIVPLAILNARMFEDPEFPEYVAYLLVSMEVPWATLLLTLYLGQVTFSRRFSTRRALRDLIRSLPAMITFQLVIRGLCLVMGILAPVVFIGMYYLNEIILLEQTPISRTWNRRTAMNARAFGRILFLRIMDLMVLLGGTMLLTSLFRNITELWEDRFEWQFGIVSDEFLHVDWPLQLAFWAVIVFLTVFRFMSYLDCRMRREGWDVELKLRSLADEYRQREVAQ